MLKAVLEHREAVDRFMADKNNDLRELELSEQGLSQTVVGAAYRVAV